VGGEQAFEPAFAAGGLAAEGELAVDDGAAQRALGVVVGRVDVWDGGECPERGPELEQVARDPARAFVARGLCGVAAQDRLELAP
jgi:hypothetical protein